MKEFTFLGGRFFFGDPCCIPPPAPATHLMAGGAPPLSPPGPWQTQTQPGTHAGGPEAGSLPPPVRLAPTRPPSTSHGKETLSPSMGWLHPPASSLSSTQVAKLGLVFCPNLCFSAVQCAVGSHFWIRCFAEQFR